ncbi:MAG TPA: excinuclease ABC subunit UvrC [Candidatus Kapabacteria bacterium]|nr:excinuclease ABC subunit UvrC [Candidatus Kapabacteria bacterium]
MDKTQIENKLKNLPVSPGVYIYKDAAGNIIYVGKAKSLRNRVHQYFQEGRPHDPKTAVLVSKIADLDWVITDSEVEALILENNLIKQHHPRYNVMLRDDKSYPYIRVTKEPFPRVFPTRKIIRDGSKYFGPYTDAKYIRYLLKTLRQLFPIRSCNFYLDDEVVEKKKVKLCLDYHIRKCDGPCEGLVSQQDYNAMIAQVEKFLNGRTREVVEAFEAQMEVYAEQMKFEEAARTRDRLHLVQEYEERQKMVMADFVDRDIFSEAHEKDDACAVVFKVRDGKVIGKQHYYLTGVEGKSQSELLETVLQRYYDLADSAPDEILVPCEPEDTETLQKWLEEKYPSEDGRKRQVQFVVPKIGDKAKLLHLCETNAKYFLDELKLQRMKRATVAPRMVLSLQRDLRLENTPLKIECFDISHFQGSETVASMVVFENGKPKKSEYRKYKIKTVEGVDDFASMKEVLRRRYTRAIAEDQDMPDLIMVDGGKGQLSSAVEVLNDLKLEDIPVIGLAKRLEEVFIPQMSDALGIPKTSSSIHLLQRVRDEAHRFAITFHRHLRDARTLHTELLDIPGIGPKTVKMLIDKFESVRGVKEASMESLEEAVGKPKAAAIKNYFANTALGVVKEQTAELVEEIE